MAIQKQSSGQMILHCSSKYSRGPLGRNDIALLIQTFRTTWCGGASFFFIHNSICIICMILYLFHKFDKVILLFFTYFIRFIFCLFFTYFIRQIKLKFVTVWKIEAYHQRAKSKVAYWKSCPSRMIIYSYNFIFYKFVWYIKIHIELLINLIN